MKHTISLLVENRAGVFVRIANLFNARGFNLDSISVGPTEDATVSRLTIVTKGDDKIVEQINKQLNKLIEVIKVVDLTEDEFVERELALLKINAPPSRRAEILELATIFRSSVVDVSPKTVTIEATGNTAKIQAMIGMLKQFGIKEMARTGAVALRREYKEN